MTRIRFLTGSGKKVCINPRTQKALFWDFQDGLIAEARLGERSVSYEAYRKRRKPIGVSESPITIARSVKKELDALDDKAFARLDAGILGLAEAPTGAGSKPKAFGVLLGNLRFAFVARYPIVYTTDSNTDMLRILRIGFNTQFTTAERKTSANSGRRRRLK